MKRPPWLCRWQRSKHGVSPYMQKLSYQNVSYNMDQNLIFRYWNRSIQQNYYSKYQESNRSGAILVVL